LPEPTSSPSIAYPPTRLAESVPSALVAAASGAVLATAFVTQVSVGAWAGLAGALYCTRLQRPLRAAGTWAVFGLVFFGISFSWMSVVTWAGFAALVAYHTAHVALFGLVLACITGNGGGGARSSPNGWHLPLTSIAPPLWVASELLRSRLLGGLPWMLLAHPFGGKTVFVQFAQWTGAAGVSFVVAMVNSAVAELGLKLPPYMARISTGRSAPRWRDGSPWVSAVAAAGVVLAACVYGTVRIVNAKTEPGPTVALIQGAVPTPAKSIGTSEEAKEVDRRLWAAYSSLTQDLAPQGKAAAGPGGTGLDLIVWPESALPGIFGSGDESEGGEGGEEAEGGASAKLRELSRRVGTPMLVGTNTLARRSAAAGAGGGGGTGGKARAVANSAVLVARGELTGRYDKVHLVPFGEYIPLGRAGRLLFRSEPLTRDYAAGSPDQPSLKVGPWSLGVSICFEDIFAPAARRQVLGGARVLVNLTNDSWFDSTAEPYQHHMAARYRAIELGVSLVRSTNTGLSSVFDPYGRAVSGPRAMEAGPLVTTVKLRCSNTGQDAPPATGYLRHGELFAWCCLAVTGLLVARRFRRQRPDASDPPGAQPAGVAAGTGGAGGAGGEA